MKRDSQEKELRRLKQEYEKSLEEGRYPVFDPEEYADLAQYYYEHGNALKAKEVVDAALVAFPDADAPLLFLARYTMLETGNLVEAESIMERVSDKFSLDYAFNRAEWLIYSERMEEASTLLTERFDSVCGDEEVEDYAEDACRFFLNFNRVDFARPWLERMPDSSSTRYVLLAAEVDRVGDDWNECRDKLSALVEKKPFCCAAWVELARIQFDLGNNAEAGEACDFALAIEPDNMEAVLVKGDVMARLDNAAEAEKLYRRYLDEYPASPAVINQLVITLAMQGDEKLPELLPLIKQAEAYVNIWFERNIYAELLQTETYVYSALNQLENAMKCIGKLYDLGCHDMDELDLLRAQVFMHCGKQLEACLVYDMVLRRNKWRIDIMVRIALYLYEGEFYEIGNFELNQTLALNPDSEYTAELLALKAIFAHACKNMEEYEVYRDRAMMKDEQAAQRILKFLEN